MIDTSPDIILKVVRVTISVHFGVLIHLFMKIVSVEMLIPQLYFCVEWAEYKFESFAWIKLCNGMFAQ